MIQPSGPYQLPREDLIRLASEPSRHQGQSNEPTPARQHAKLTEGKRGPQLPAVLSLVYSKHKD